MKYLKRLALFAIVGAVLSSLFLVGCEESKPSGTAGREMVATEANQEVLTKADPPPSFTESQERKNIIRRMKNFNVPNKISYITLFSDTGALIRYDVIKGKVSAVDSTLKNPEQVLDDPNGSFDAGSVVIPSPDLDGTYGSNGDSIFYFTTSGEYVEWDGPYLLTDRPQQTRVEPLIIVDATKKYIKSR